MMESLEEADSGGAYRIRPDGRPAEGETDEGEER